MSKNVVALIVVGCFFGYLAVGYLLGLPLRARRMARGFAELDQMELSEAERKMWAGRIEYSCGYWHGLFFVLWPIMIFAPALLRVGKFFSKAGYPDDAVSRRYLG